MVYPFKLNKQAYEEYLDAYEWYELKQKGLGERFAVEVEEKLQRISAHPEYYSKRHSSLREAKVDNFPFMIVYEFFKRKRLIHIAAIYHSRRNPGKKYRRTSK